MKGKAAAELSHYFAGTVDDPRWRRAACKGRRDLPWTDDGGPNLEQFQAMQEICADCPVIGRCAGYGLTTSGGFYAGHWVPYKGPGPDGDNTARLRARARLGLRRVALRHGWTCIICRFPNESGVVLCVACGSRYVTG